MRSLIVQEFISLNGVLQSPEGYAASTGAIWTAAYMSLEQMDLMTSQMRQAGALLLGRKTYEAFAASWPFATEMQGLRDRINAMPKYVASTTIREFTWNASPLSGRVLEAVRRLKDQPGGDIVVLGSATLVNHLAAHDLIDEIRLWIHPVALGDGVRLFDEETITSEWNLRNMTTTNTGVVIVTYAR